MGPISRGGRNLKTLAKPAQAQHLCSPSRGWVWWPWDHFSRLSFLGVWHLVPFRAPAPFVPRANCQPGPQKCHFEGPAQPLCRSFAHPSLQVVVGVGSGTPSQLWAGTTNSKRCTHRDTQGATRSERWLSQSTSFREEATCPSCFVPAGDRVPPLQPRPQLQQPLLSVSHLTENCKDRMWGEGQEPLGPRPTQPPAQLGHRAH